MSNLKIENLAQDTSNRPGLGHSGSLKAQAKQLSRALQGTNAASLDPNENPDAWQDSHISGVTEEGRKAAVEVFFYHLREKYYGGKGGEEMVE